MLSHFYRKNVMLKQNEFSRANRIEVHVAHISAKAAEDVFRKIYDLSEKYEYDIDLKFNLVTHKFDSFHICNKQLSDKKKIALFNELKTTTNAIQRVVML